jgi:hypothetical protein
MRVSSRTHVAVVELFIFSEQCISDGCSSNNFPLFTGVIRVLKQHCLGSETRGSRKYPNCWSYSLTDWYASANNLRGTPRGSRKNPNVGKSPTCRLWTADANSHKPCPCRAVPWPWKVFSERHVRGMVGRGMGAERGGMGAERGGIGTVWTRHGMRESNTGALCKSNGKGAI